MKFNDIDYDFTFDTIGTKKGIKNYTKKSVLERYIKYRETSGVDPDCYSTLLQEVYKNKWNEKYLSTCKVNRRNKYYSDTMTSVQGLLNHFIKDVCTSDWQLYKNQKGNEKVKFCSEKAFIKIYKNKGLYKVFSHYFIEDNKDSKIILNFIKSYHTIGNYIPVPQYFNKNRSGYFANHDMWDLTLLKIKEYYNSKNNEKVLKEMLFNKGNYEYTKLWLDSFGDWPTFIKDNYLKDYVDNKYEIKEELTKIHNWDKTYPDKDMYLKYFEMVTKLINNRSKYILNNEK
jgi:hypothetical protein